MRKANGRIKGLVTVGVAGILAAGVCCMGFVIRNEEGKWFRTGELTTQYGKEKFSEAPDEAKSPVKTGEGETPNDQDSELAFEKFKDKGIMLTSARTTMATEEGFASYFITATVIPENATNKAVDWTLEAGEGFVGEVGECLTVTTEQDGALTAEVTCLKAFEGTATLKVTTRDGGFFATCNITFKGKPQFIKIDTSSLSASETDTVWEQTIYKINTESEYSLGLSLGNVYNSVDSSITPHFEIELTGIGEFYADHKLYQGRTVKSNYGSKTCSYTTNNISGKNYTGTGGLQRKIVFNPAKTLYSVNLEGAAINIKTNEYAIEDFFESYALSSDALQSEKLTFSRYRFADHIPYLEIKVTETGTGISEVINVRLKKTATE